MYKKSLGILIWFLFMTIIQLTYGRKTGRPPEWVLTPPKELWIDPIRGGEVTCTASGIPSPHVTWYSEMDSPVVSIHGVLQVSNSSLMFLPSPRNSAFFPAHGTFYYCRATNIFGTLLSDSVRVKTMPRVSWETRPEDQHIIRGNTAYITCANSALLNSFVRVTSWEDGRINYFADQLVDPRIRMAYSGELVIQNVTKDDELKRYRCRTLNTLTGETKQSTRSARIYIRAHVDNTQPKIEMKDSNYYVTKGKSISLLCPVTGVPPPNVRWKKLSNSSHFYSSTSYQDFWHNRQSSFPINDFASFEELPQGTVISGPLINIRSATERHRGTYECQASNSLGVSNKKVKLDVITPLKVRIEPPSAEVAANNDAKFICKIEGFNDGKVEWIKDGSSLHASSKIRFVDNSRTLVITSVGEEDEGIYQCLVKTRHESKLAATHLILGDTPPRFLYRFIEQTTQPGPTVSLKCIAAGTPTPSMQWKLDGYPLIHNDRVLRGQFVAYGGHVVSHVNISSIEAINGGLYSCTARNKMQSITHSARLNVYGVPTVRPMPDVNAIASETLILNCPVGGYPVHQIYWSKGGKKLPLSRRQNVHLNGSLSIKNVQPKADAGRYSCTAVSRSSHASTQAVYVHVLVPPRISPFEFKDNPTAGIRLQVSCSLEQGDLPVIFKWFKNDQSLANSYNIPSSSLDELSIKITQFDEFSSILLIPKLDKRHSGNYTCRVANKARETGHTSSLKVSVPPEWIQEPLDTIVIKSRQIAVPCKAEGYPVPTTTWRLVHDKKIGSYFDIAVSNSRINTVTNGTLFIYNASKVDEGKYLCEVYNGIGAGLSKVIEISVKVPPEFTLHTVNTTAVLGKQAVINCSVRGDSPLLMTWKINQYEIDTRRSFRYDKRTYFDTKSQLNVEELTIRRVTSEDEGTYECRASNEHGEDAKTIFLLVQDVPSAPQAVRIIAKTSRHVDLSWESPKNGNSPITKYVMKYTQNDNKGLSSILKEIRIDAGNKSTRISDLYPSTTYVFSLSAHNDIGSSTYSKALQITTEGEPPGSPPRNLNATPVSSSAIETTWQPPEASKTHGKIIVYNIAFREHGTSNDSYRIKSLHTSLDNFFHKNCCSYQLTDLKANKKYIMAVQAINSHGKGPLTDEFSIATLQDVPAVAPSGLSCHGEASRSLHVSWKQLSTEDARGDLLGYKLSYYESKKNNGKEEATTSISRKINGLKPYTNYSLQIKAFTSIGDGPLSNVIICLTDEDVPGPPSAIKVLSKENKGFVVTWRSPNNPNGKLLSYTIKTRTSKGKTKKYLVTHPKIRYDGRVEAEVRWIEVSVSAKTKIGEGKSSIHKKVMITDIVPAAVVSWSKDYSVHRKEDANLACDAVGSPRPIRSWFKDERQIHKNMYNGELNILSDGTLNIRNIAQDKAGNYKCFVTNSNGNGSVSYNIIVKVPPSAPAIKIVLTAKNTIELSCYIKDNGGDPLSYVKLSYKRKAGEWIEKIAEPDQKTYILENLKCGTEYQIFATGYNKAGEGKPSKVVTTRTMGSLPKTKRSSTNALSPKDTWALLNFSDWLDNGCHITMFSVSYKSADEDTWIAVSEQSDRTSTTIAGLKPDTSYVVRVTAHNSVGSTSKNYNFFTLAGEGGSSQSHSKSLSNYLTSMNELRVILPVVASFFVLLATCVTVVVCVKRKSSENRNNTNSNGNSSSIILNQDSTRKYLGPEEHFYATIQNTGPYDRKEKEYEVERLNRGRISEKSDNYMQYKQSNVKPNNNKNQTFSNNLDIRSTQGNNFTHIESLQGAGERKWIKNPLGKYKNPPMPCHQEEEYQYHISNDRSIQQGVTSIRNLDHNYLSINTQNTMRTGMKSESDEYDTFGSDSEIDSLPVRLAQRHK